MRRRELLLGLTAGMGALLGPRLARASEARRVLIVGSSAMAGAFGGALHHGLEALGYEVHRRHRSSSSLTRPDFFDWFAEGDRLYESFRPHATLVFFAANDAQALFTESDPAWIQFHDEKPWTEAYRARVNRFADVVSPRGERVVWIGAPVMRSPKLNERMQRTNKIYEEEMRWRRSAMFVDTWASLADGRGNYADRIRIDGTTKKVRAPDGVHFNRTGANILADLILPRADRFFKESLLAAAPRELDAACESPHPRAPSSSTPIVATTTR
jgi:hypothetical protein